MFDCKSFRTRFACAALLSALTLGATICTANAAGTTAATPSQRSWHSSLECSACHKTTDTATSNAMSAPAADACLDCHESPAAVAKRTSKLDSLGLNPHDNYHYGRNLDCVFCHREHKASYDACNECHDFSAHVKPAP